MKFLVHVDFSKNEIRNTVVQNLSSAPSSPSNGQIYYDTTLNQFGCRQNGTWVYLGASGSGDVVGPSSSVDNEVVLFNGTTGKLIKSASITGIAKLTAGVLSAAVAGTDYVTGSSTNTLTNKTIDANGTGNSIINLEVADFATNVVDTDGTLAANSDTRLASQKAIKTYVDALSQGIKWKSSVRAASTANGTLASAFQNGSSLDGVTLATNDRILLKDQTTQTENGIYIVNASGAPTRATDADTGTEIKQAAVFVEEGTVNADNAFVNTNNGTVTIGSTNITFVSFVSATVPDATTSIKGKVALADSTVAEAKSDSAKALTAASVVNFTIKKTFTIGNGSSTTITCTHNLNTKDVVVWVRDASTDEQVFPDIQNNNVNSVDVIFTSAPASNAYKVTVIG